MSAHVELPGIWFDQVIFDTLGLASGVRFIDLINRSPEPGATDVQFGTLISVDVMTANGDAVDASGTAIYVSINGGPEVLAFDGPTLTFQPGWDGPQSGTAGLGGVGTRFTIDPTSDFGSLENVTIRVVAATVSTPVLYLDKSWSFTIEDLTAPTIASAKATDLDTVLVTFSEPVDSSLALVAANYVITRQSSPAVDVVVTSVSENTTDSVILTLDIEMTPGATYLIEVSNVTDLPGNVIGAPGNTIEFTGYQCAEPDGRQFDIWRQMISRKNRDQDSGDLAKLVACFQESLDLFLCSIDRWTRIFDPDRAPEAFVDAILYDLGNPFDFDLSLAEKRKLIRILVPIYRQKGTGVGIVNAVRFFLGISVVVVAYNTEGWVLGVSTLGETTILGPSASSSLYSFEIQSPVSLIADQRDQIRQIANYMKPAHTHLIDIVEPTIPTVIDHLELGLSELGTEWILH